MPAGKMSISNKPQGVGSPNQSAVRVRIKRISERQPLPPPRLMLFVLLICLL